MMNAGRLLQDGGLQFHVLFHSHRLLPVGTNTPQFKIEELADTTLSCTNEISHQMFSA